MVSICTIAYQNKNAPNGASFIYGAGDQIDSVQNKYGLRSLAKFA